MDQQQRSRPGELSAERPADRRCKQRPAQPPYLHACPGVGSHYEGNGKALAEFVQRGGMSSLS